MIFRKTLLPYRLAKPLRASFLTSTTLDWFVFNAEAGKEYRIFITLDTLEWSLLLLHSSDSQLVETQNESRLTWLAPDSGAYYVEILSFFDTGTYTLTVTAVEDESAEDGGGGVLQDDHGDSQDAATAISVGETLEGSLENWGDEDYFRFTAQAGRFYQIDVELGTLDDSYLVLLESDGWHLADNDDFGGSLASHIAWAAPESGDYYLVVGGYGEGSYTLTLALSDVQDDHANEIDDATPIQVGQSAAGNLDYNGDIDYFSFTARSGQIYQIDVALGTLGDSVMALLDADPSWVLAENDDYGDSYASRIIWEATESGDYFIAVGAWGSDTGSYTLTIAVQ